MKKAVDKIKGLSSERDVLLSRLDRYGQCYRRFGVWPHEIKKIRLTPVDGCARETSDGWVQSIIYSSEVTTIEDEVIRVERVNVKHFIETGRDQDMR